MTSSVRAIEHVISGPEVGIRHPAARLAALRANPAVALTIDTEQFPPEVLTVRGRAEIDHVDGLAAEYVASAHRYLGDEAAAEMLASMDRPGTVQARIVVRPTWAGLLDFSSRRPRWCAPRGSGSSTSRPADPARWAACEPSRQLVCVPTLRSRNGVLASMPASLGRPSTRSPTMFFMTSSVPPATFMPGTPRRNWFHW